MPSVNDALVTQNFTSVQILKCPYFENKIKYLKNLNSLGYRNISTYIIKYENLELKVVE